jgi:hypothetical protein
VLAIVFTPGLNALRIGQISPWLLAGVVGFLIAERGRRDLLAGASLSVLMIKPHVAYLFWLAALWWAWQSRRRGVLVGWLAALVVASAITLVLVPDLFANYLSAAGDPPLGWATAAVGFWLRALVGPERAWLQFLPFIVGLAGLAIWFWRRHGPWVWANLASPLLLCSVLTTPFGWSFDQIVLLPVVLDLVARLRRAKPVQQATALGLLGLFQLALLTQNYYQFGDHFSVWYAMALAVLYCWFRNRVRGGETLQANGA